MTAPTLVMVAPGSRDQRVVRMAHALQAELTRMRPEVAPTVTFMDTCLPRIDKSLRKLHGAGIREAVLVPLDLVHAVEVDPRYDGVVAQAATDLPGLKLQVARPVGPEATLLSVLDLRLRAALAQARVLELDGLILSSPTTGDVRGTALLARRARQWSTHHRLPCLTAVADGSGPSVTQAIQGLRAQGRRHIAVGSFFLTGDERFAVQADQARRGGAIAVSEPLGASAEVAEIVLARYAFAAMELLAFDEEGNFSTDDVDFAATA